MELKKREEILERDYAKKEEISKSELKKTTPKKWLVASAMGVATLFYSNPRSIFGSIGVVFGCVSYGSFTPLGNGLNHLATLAQWFSFIFAIAAILMMMTSFIRTIGIDKKSDEEKERLKRLSKSDAKGALISFVIALIFLSFFVAWEFWLSNSSFFIDPSFFSGPALVPSAINN